MQLVLMRLRVAGQWLKGNQVIVLFIAALWTTSILTALLWPLPESHQSVSNPGVSAADNVDNIDENFEDLSAFLENSRWGVSLRTIIEQAEGINRPAVNPVLKEMGYVGLISRIDQHQVLLMMPNGDSQRLSVGDTLPDGRELVALGENSLTLRDAAQNIEKLLLFPELSPDLREYPANIEKELERTAREP